MKEGYYGEDYQVTGQRVKGDASRLKSIASKLDRANFYEYMLYVQDKKRIMRVSFLSGIMRGLGGAIGFTLLGAVVVYILQRIADSHLPGIAEFIAELINIVNSKRS